MENWFVCGSTNSAKPRSHVLGLGSLEQMYHVPYLEKIDAPSPISSNIKHRKSFYNLQRYAFFQ